MSSSLSSSREKLVKVLAESDAKTPVLPVVFVAAERLDACCCLGEVGMLLLAASIPFAVTEANLVATMIQSIVAFAAGAFNICLKTNIQF